MRKNGRVNPSWKAQRRAKREVLQDEVLRLMEMAGGFTCRAAVFADGADGRNGAAVRRLDDVAFRGKEGE